MEETVNFRITRLVTEVKNDTYSCKSHLIYVDKHVVILVSLGFLIMGC
jgi:hypothetical protein